MMIPTQQVQDTTKTKRQQVNTRLPEVNISNKPNGWYQSTEHILNKLETEQYQHTKTL